MSSAKEDAWNIKIKHRERGLDGIFTWYVSRSLSDDEVKW